MTSGHLGNPYCDQGFYFQKWGGGQILFAHLKRVPEPLPGFDLITFTQASSWGKAVATRGSLVGEIFEPEQRG